MNKLFLNISGMHCQSCQKLLESTLADLPGVSSAKIDYPEGKGQVEGKIKLDEQKIIAAIKQAGR